MATVVKRSARAILIDGHARLLLLKHTKSGQPPYWMTPGGGVDSGDASPAAALRRELLEELGASAEGAEQVFLFSSPGDGGVSVQHFFVCHLGILDWSSRTGDEYSNPQRGGYDLDYIDLRDDSLSRVDLKPAAVKEFILANVDALLDEADSLAHGEAVAS